LAFKEAKREIAIINKGNSWLDSFIDGLRLYRKKYQEERVRRVAVIWRQRGISVNKGYSVTVHVCVEGGLL
jgi:ribosomal protein L27